MSEETILSAIHNLDERLTGKLGGLERKINVLQQDLREVRSLITEIIQDMKPDVMANREHLLKLERQQEKFNIRLETVERKVAGLA